MHLINAHSTTSGGLLTLLSGRLLLGRAGRQKSHLTPEVSCYLRSSGVQDVKTEPQNMIHTSFFLSSSTFYKVFHQKKPHVMYLLQKELNEIQHYKNLIQGKMDEAEEIVGVRKSCSAGTKEARVGQDYSLCHTR